jgi:hypothetical protein
MTQFKEPGCAIGQPIRWMSAICWHVPKFLVLRQKFIHLHIAELMPMSADVLNPQATLCLSRAMLWRARKANAGSKIQLAIIVLAHQKCGPNIKLLSVRT